MSPNIHIISILGSVLFAGCGCGGGNSGLPDAGTIVMVPTQPQTCPDVERCQAGCRDGKAVDCLHLAGNFSLGRNVAVDEAKAAVLFERGCTLGNGPACILAGRILEFAHGVSKDYERAVGVYRRACDLGYQPGCFNLAVMDERGRGAPKDEALAYRLYASICNADMPSACNRAQQLLGHIAEGGDRDK